MGRRVVTRRHAVRLFSIIAVFTLIVDQVSKVLVREVLRPSQSIELVGDLLNLTYVRNTGAAFGLMPGRRELFIVVAVIELAGIAFFMWKTRHHSKAVAVSLGLISGGAIGNLIDRVAFGTVTDFIELSVIPVFNAADSGIVVGVMILMAWVFLHASEHDPVTESSDG